jgi:hypothetical protein
MQYLVKLNERSKLKAAAYFNGMLEKARAGELNLLASIFGLLKKGSVT